MLPQGDTEMTTTVTMSLEELHQRVEGAYHKANEKGTLQNFLDGVVALCASVDKSVGVQAPAIIVQKAPEPQPTRYGLPVGFTFAQVEQRIARLEKEFPGLDSTHVMKLAETYAKILPPRESIYVGPKTQILCASGEKHPYNAASIIVVGKLALKRDINNFVEGRLSPKYLRPWDPSWKLWKKWEKETPGDYIVKPFQYGDLHLTKSANDTRKTVQNGEALMGVFHNTVTFLSDEEEAPRIDGEKATSYLINSLDEYAPHAGGDFWFSLSFDWGDGRLNLGSCNADDADPRYGSSSAFAS